MQEVMKKAGDQRVGDWIQTISGLAMYPLDPRPEEIEIFDIAIALSHVCRFTGHVQDFYSVAQHSVLVSRLVPEEDALWALLHDASEAYLSDIARPVKVQPEFEAYREIEYRLQSAIVAKFGLPVLQPASVKKADEIMLAIEARDLLGNLRPGWEKWLVNIGDCKVKIRDPWPSAKASMEFMLRFDELKNGRRR